MDKSTYQVFRQSDKDTELPHLCRRCGITMTKLWDHMCTVHTYKLITKLCTRLFNDQSNHVLKYTCIIFGVFDFGIPFTTQNLDIDS